jgi:transposase-like protein
VATAREQMQRDAQIAADRLAGMTVAALAEKYGVSKTTIKAAIRRTRELHPVRPAAIDLAERRWAEYDEIVGELRELAHAIPVAQASAKVGAYKVLLEALDRRTKFEQDLGHLPADLRELGDERRLAEAFAAVVELHGVSPAAVADLKSRLSGRLWAA